MVSLAMCLDAVPSGIPVRVAVKLRGGAAAHSKKLRELLLSKGVHQDDVSDRMAEIVSAIGDQGLVDAFSCFDSWQALKAKCHGKVRIIKQAESRRKARRPDEEPDPLQASDPWAEAIQARNMRPDASFFQTSSSKPPAVLQSVTRGASGIIMVDEKEALLLAQSQDDMSPDELAAITLGEHSFQGAKRPCRAIEFPCYDQHNARLLVKGTLIDLGSAHIKVAGEDTVHDMQVASSSCLAVEVHRDDYEEWDDFTQAPVRHLKKVFALTSQDVIHSWGRKAYRQGKLQPSMDQADSVFLMLRIRSDVLEDVLKLAVPGLFSAPRLENGQPDHNYKVVWCGDKSMAELRVMAKATQGCLGVVKSRSGQGIRVKCSDFSAVKSKLVPEWVPQQNTPYDEALPLRYEMHHVHPGAGREDLQRLLNEVPWKAIVLRQTRPKQWLVAAQCPPPRDTILTVHGCILVLPSSAVGDKGVGKGRGKSSRTRSRGPDWLLGSHGAVQPVAPSSEHASAQSVNPHTTMPPGAPQGPVKKAMLEVEQKMEERLNSMRQEAASTHKLMQQDIQNMRDDFKEHVSQQRQEVRAVSERVDNIEASLSNQLSSFMTNLNTTLSQQSADLTGRIEAGQLSLREELTSELRQHMGNVRKRTPPPPDADSEKTARLKE